ncbi:MAG: hypothetical protein M1821_006646 [Bathelium mastoideum]|nr:MAG: hypothetical protein M1821_006646 [Bathelium mastoideum]
MSDSSASTPSDGSRVASTSTIVASDCNDPVAIAWETALTKLKNHHNKDQMAIITSASSPEAILSHLDMLEIENSNRSALRWTRKCRTFVKSLQQYSDTLNIFSNCHLATALLWGSIKLLMELSRRILKEGTGARLLRRILWNDFQAESSRIMANISRHRDLIDVEMNASNVVEAKAAREIDRIGYDLFKCVEVTKWLSPADVNDNLERLRTCHLKGTGDWLFKEHRLKAWMTGQQKLFWVYGIPGCGKSVLCSCLIERLQTSGAHIAYFFCDSGSPTKRTSLGILRSLVAQLVAGNPELVSLAVDALVSSAQEHATSCRSLLDLLSAILARTRHRTYIVIDAWDECEDGRRSSLMNDLQGLSNAFDLHLGLFSRQEPWLQYIMESWTTLGVTSDSIAHDIAIYVDHFLGQPPLSKLDDPAIEDEIRKTLVSKANGQFLWVRLMVETFQRARFLSDINAILRDVPRGLGQLYNRVLESLLHQPERAQVAAFRLLCWLSCSERHLTMTELSAALAVRPGASEAEDNDNVLDLASFLDDVCGSLITVTKPNGDLDIVEVRFVHSTVKEYLLSSEELFGEGTAAIKKFAVHKEEANQHLALICITYMTLDNDKDGCDGTERSEPIITDPASLPPFLQYASSFWFRHLACSGFPSIELIRLLHKFLSSEKLLHYLERVFSTTYSGVSRGSLLVAEAHLQDWIKRCNTQDPRLTLVIDCFQQRLQTTLQQRTQQYGSHDLRTIDSQFSLAQLQHGRGEWKYAEHLFRQVFDARVEILGKSNSDTTKAMLELGIVLRRLGRLEESQQLHRECLQLRKESLGNKDPMTLSAADELSNVLKESNCLEEAGAIARSTLVKKEALYGGEDLETVRTRNNLAAILKDVGRKEQNEGNVLLAQQAFWECESLSLQCLFVREKRLGLDSPDTITCVNMLGIVTRHLARLEESERYHRRALEARLRLFGPNNPHTQRSMRHLIATLKDQGNTVDADRLGERLRQSTLANTVLDERDQTVGWDQVTGPSNRLPRICPQATP